MPPHHTKVTSSPCSMPLSKVGNGNSNGLIVGVRDGQRNILHTDLFGSGSSLTMQL